MKITVWHGEKHDDFTTTEIILEPTLGMENRTHSPDENKWIAKVKADGGFWVSGHDSGNYSFIPWHRINYIDVAR